MSIFEYEHEEGGQVFPSPRNIRVERIEEKVGPEEMDPDLANFLETSPEGINPTRVTIRGGIWYYRAIKEVQEENIEGIYSTHKARKRFPGEPQPGFYAVTPEGLVLPVPYSSRNEDPLEEWNTFGFGARVHLEGRIPILSYIETKNLSAPLVSTLATLTFNPTSPN